jgi:glutathione S-transferase
MRLAVLGRSAKPDPSKPSSVMLNAPMKTKPVLVGRSSSHFTRVARLFAHELEVEHDFSPVYEIASTEAFVFGDNPSLRVPSLRTEAGTWFGSVNVCRELARRSTKRLRIVWPEEHSDLVTANAFELVSEGMAAEVQLIMAKASGLTADHPFLAKPSSRILGSLDFLEANLPHLLRALPPRDTSLLETMLFCYGEHLGFREILSIADRPRLTAFVAEWRRRPSALATPYGFDRPG